MFVVVCCDRGAPGSTTTALALAASLPGDSILVEADPYGGDLSLRCRLPGGGVMPETPTVLTIATAARTSQAPDILGRYAHRLADGLHVIPGHASAEQAAGITDWTPMASALRASASRPVVDVGRIHERSPSMPIAAAADVLVVVSRADLASVVHLRDRLCRLVPTLAEQRGRPPSMLPVVVADRRSGARHAAEVRQLLASTAASPAIVDVGWVAWDPAGVTSLERGQIASRVRPRSALMRSASTVAEQVVAAADWSATGLRDRGAVEWR